MKRKGKSDLYAQIEATAEAMHEPHTDVKDLLKEIELALDDYFWAIIQTKRNRIILKQLNGQTFKIAVTEVV